MRKAAFFLLALIAAAPARADESEHDRARRAVEAGEIRPLREILDAAEAAFGGRLIEAELESEDGRLVYEIKLLTVEGRVLKVYYDARSGAPLETRDRNRRR